MVGAQTQRELAAFAANAELGPPIAAMTVT